LGEALNRCKHRWSAKSIPSDIADSSLKERPVVNVWLTIDGAWLYLDASLFSHLDHVVFSQGFLPTEFDGTSRLQNR
jgi:hypothetical protein